MSFNSREQVIKQNIRRYRDGGKISAAEEPIWISAALQNEDETYAILDEKPFAFANRPRKKFIPTADHCTQEFLNVCDRHNGDQVRIYNTLIEDLPIFTDAARRRDLVRNENTFSSALTTNFLILAATTQASPKFASFPAFTRDVKVDPLKPLAEGVFKFNTSPQDGSTAQTNATNFEQGDSALSAVSVTVNQYNESFHVSNEQLNSGLQLKDLADAKMASLGSKVSQALFANITAANFLYQTPLIVPTASFGFSDMKTAWTAIKKAAFKNLILDGAYLANVTNVPSLFQPTPFFPGAAWKNLMGWDYVALHTEWSAAGANIFGFACGPTALGIIAGVPLVDYQNIPAQNIGRSIGIMPGSDLPIAAHSWFNTSTRTYWASLDIMFGGAPLDTTIGVPIAIGTPS